MIAFFRSLCNNKKIIDKRNERRSERRERLISGHVLEKKKVSKRDIDEMNE